MCSEVLKGVLLNISVPSERLYSYMGVQGNCSGACWCSWNKAKSHLTVLSLQFICPLEPVERVPAKRVPSIGPLCSNYTLINISQLNLRERSTTDTHGTTAVFTHDTNKTKLKSQRSLTKISSEGYWTIHEKNECISYSNFIYLLNDSSEYIMCVFYIAVFGMSLVWGISTNAPNKRCPRAPHKTEIPFSWLTGFLLSCGHRCLLTSYCKRRMPCKSRPKVRGGFCQGWKRTWGQIVIKGLTGVWWMNLCMPVWERWVFTSQHVLYNLQYVFGDLSTHASLRVSSALSHSSVLSPIVRLHPWLLLRPLPHLCGAGPWYAPVKHSHTLW